MSELLLLMSVASWVTICWKTWILTRARKGMVVFVPRGDLTGDDMTRSPQFYDSIAEHLLRCGARQPRDGS